MTNASASRVLDGSNPDRPAPAAKLDKTRASHASLTGAAGMTPAVLPRLEAAVEAGPEPTSATASATRSQTARELMSPADARPERSGMPSEAAWDGPVDLWVDDIDGDWDTELPWSTRVADS